ncbi:hypothetical protein EIB18_16800 [Caulobacter vibrioides]|nr:MULTISPECIES: hypothetical protein [Caulobacter]ATC26055.1 hypothetical protein CA608_16695 [Caulobacter vibrioides]AZH14196.1 hypothetical protein EIB18_16800 [Caulobacter vibrioides]MCY1649055.1 hypothetical protein [Caulobacter sp. SL161]PLR16847.1 hypothetical protein CVUC_00305 [Caulobacter vibrioides]
MLAPAGVAAMSSKAREVVRRRMVGKVSEPRYERFMRQPRGGSASVA